MKLKIGDASIDGQVRIVDEDKLCFLVESNSHGAYGLRTISKSLLSEYVEYFKLHPQASANDARSALCGLSNIDKFEYGYSSTLRTMAQMLLDQIGVTTIQIDFVQKKKWDFPLQQIVYGAPGTGKSFDTDDKIHKVYPKDSEEEKKYVFRTTFHPDSDYSTFVGCYKPTKLQNERGLDQSLLNKDELVAKLKEYRVLYDETMAQTKFGFDYYEELSKSAELTDIIKDAGVKTFDTAVRIGMSLAERNIPKRKESSITYDYVPQAFTKAYVAAWESVLKDENKPVFLVIEEVNRGNCAQIFGDLFQLLDRGIDNRSCYPIKPDTDLGCYIGKQLGDLLNEENSELNSIALGEEMLLPENLYIWATMNTSDQSLFPIDSAFKRRWDWKYVKIKDEGKKWMIEGGQDWYAFIKKINGLIAGMTQSADKQLGYFFCKADDKGSISCETFVNKVCFYLWNDVFKNFCSDEYAELFKVKKGEKDCELTFPDFFDDMNGVIPEVAQQFVANVMNYGVEKDDSSSSQEA